jgi:hypothetical protein
MNAPFPQIKEAASVASRDWHAVLRPFLGRWEPVLESDGRPLMYESARLARAAALGHPGGGCIFMGRWPVAPSVERIREVANPPRETCPPVSFDLDATASDRSAFDAWRA